jgi:serine/threonine-protein kinase
MTTDLHPDPLLGKTVAGKYRVEALLGRGGMGAVYEATHLAINKRVALKFLYRDSAHDLDAVLRFQREAEAASAVESEHIVQIFDSGASEDGLPFLVMELLRGEDLRTRLRRLGSLDVAEVLTIGIQVARALRRAHAAGIVHRDLKPDNIFLCARDDGALCVKLVDFGISKVSRKTATADTLTRRGMVLGTAFYMSPEQAQAARDVDGRADLFSLGAILFEALTGQPPHTGTVYEAILIAICTKDAPDVRTLAPHVPEPLARLVARALERDRDARYASADALLAAFGELVPGLAGSAPYEQLPLLSGALGSQALGSQALGSHSLGTPALSARPVSSRADGPRASEGGTVHTASGPEVRTRTAGPLRLIAVLGIVLVFAAGTFTLARRWGTSAEPGAVPHAVTTPSVASLSLQDGPLVPAASVTASALARAELGVTTASSNVPPAVQRTPASPARATMAAAALSAARPAAVSPPAKTAAAKSQGVGKSLGLAAEP